MTPINTLDTIEQPPKIEREINIDNLNINDYDHLENRAKNAGNLLNEAFYKMDSKIASAKRKMSLEFGKGSKGKRSTGK